VQDEGCSVKSGTEYLYLVCVHESLGWVIEDVRHEILRDEEWWFQG
jgi:hypothetical protein